MKTTDGWKFVRRRNKCFSTMFSQLAVSDISLNRGKEGETKHVCLFIYTSNEATNVYSTPKYCNSQLIKLGDNMLIVDV